MSTFEDFRLTKPLRNAIKDLGFVKPTPIQKESFSVILSGKDMVGIAQTGTGKTLGYMLPILDELKFSKQNNPRILVIVPTRELVIQVVDNIAAFTRYMNVRTIGVYGGVNMNKQVQSIMLGSDIIVATPGRLYDLALSNALNLKGIKKLVIDEVDVMLDLGFRTQLTNIMELLPDRRQNIMFSATMTEHVDVLIDDFFIQPKKISIALSGTPLDNISQTCYQVRNFYTKVNLLKHLLSYKDEYKKVIVFVSNKRSADRLFESIQGAFNEEVCVIHSNKTQNYRIRSIEDFDSGKNRILVSTDVMARGLDLEQISHVINFDTPDYPENYMHRIGRSGRAEHEGKAILFYTKKELEWKESIEKLMCYEIPQLPFPSEVELSNELTPEERPKEEELVNHNRNTKHRAPGEAFHEKKAKNAKTNQGGSYKRKKAKKYKKAQTRGDKTYHKRQKRG
ncbi:MAG: DEAD/DEAH box helicase [Crocinitomicaceae bacterium]|nr:DEAD/DEAH box helicase [Crocinitomicaceae bacterium]